MKVLVVQNRVCKTKSSTIKDLSTLIKDIDFKALDLVVFPEMFLTPYDIKHLLDYKETSNGIGYQFLKSFSREHNVFVVGGSIPFEVEGKILNSSFIFDNKGNEIDRYDKQSLFNIVYPDGSHFDESDVLSKGNRFVTFKINDILVGIMICFDIRFPILAQTYRDLGCDMIIVPAAFNTFTGPLHWETLFRSRAIDNQLFTIGCSPSSDSYGEYNTYGHSIAVDPFGRVISTLEENSSYMIVDIDFSLNKEIRSLIPIQ